jgi:diguanylate cyclase (GGDEF)-like protein
MIPFEYKGNEMQLGASVGISLYPQHGKDAESLLSAADEAMYRVKNKGKNGYVIAENTTEVAVPALTEKVNQIPS